MLNYRNAKHMEWFTTTALAKQNSRLKRINKSLLNAHNRRHWTYKNTKRDWFSIPFYLYNTFGRKDDIIHLLISTISRHLLHQLKIVCYSNQHGLLMSCCQKSIIISSYISCIFALPSYGHASILWRWTTGNKNVFSRLYFLINGNRSTSLWVG